MNKKRIYNSIMEKVSVIVKNAINEAAESYSPSSISEIIKVFNNAEISSVDVDKKLQEVTVVLNNTIDSEDEEYLFDIDIIYDYSCSFIPGDVPLDRDIEPTPDSLGIKITPKEVVLYEDGTEKDRIPASAFVNMKNQIDLDYYENDALEAVEEEENPADWEDDFYEN